MSGEGTGTPGPLNCSLSPTLPLSQLTGDLESPLSGNMHLNCTGGFCVASAVGWMFEEYMGFTFY